jgi:hypothetical protein
MKKLLIFLLWASLLLLAPLGRAQCSGTSPNKSCLAGTTSAQLITALGSNNNGDIYTFAAGSYTWSTMAAFPTASGATFICATAPPGSAPFGAATTGGCNVSVTGNCVLGISSWAGSGLYFPSNYRISGFNFTPTSASNAPICWPNNANPVSEGVFTSIRFDHNTFNDVTGSVAISLGVSGHRMYLYGVIDHNNLLCAGSCLFVDHATTADPLPAPNPLGTGNNMFMEDNYLTMATMTNAGEGCIDNLSAVDTGESTYAVVVRHNQATNCDWTGHPGPANYEFYNNTTIQNASSASQDCYRSFHTQTASLGMFHDNVFTCNTSPSSDVMEVAYLRGFAKVNSPKYPSTLQCDGFVNYPPLVDGNRSPSSTNQGYPCQGQPGRDQATQTLFPMYGWNNTKNGSLAQLTLANLGAGVYLPLYFLNQFQVNREWYNATGTAQTTTTSPWNCNTGTDMGWGLLANRPTAASCPTYTGEAGGGLGYFATDQGPQGTLYQLQATGWVAIHQPYTYPHPLVAGTARTAFPTFNVAPGPYLTTQTVTVSDSSPSPTLYCTTDGSAPTHASTSYAGSHAFTVSTTQTINCLAASSGLLDSLTLSGGFYIGATANSPQPNPPGGYFPTGTLTVQLSNPQQLVRNCITDDGSTPTSSGLNDGNCGHTHITSGAANGTNQFSTVNVSSTLTIQALTTGINFTDSPILSTTYTIGGTNGLWWQDRSPEQFGTQTVGIASGTMPIQFTNPGSTSTTISSYAVTGTGFASVAGGSCSATPITIAAGGYCTLLLTFTPPSSGSFTGALTLTDNVAGSPHVIALNGTGAGGSVPLVTFSPTSVSFGNQIFGTSSSPQTVTLSNTGTATLTYSSITVTGTNASDFVATAGTCVLGGSTLTAGSSCTVSIVFTPVSGLGTHSAFLKVTSNAASSPDNLPLSGVGVNPSTVQTVAPPIGLSVH